MVLAESRGWREREVTSTPRAVFRWEVVLVCPLIYPPSTSGSNPCCRAIFRGRWDELARVGVRPRSYSVRRHSPAPRLQPISFTLLTCRCVMPGACWGSPINGSPSCSGQLQGKASAPMGVPIALLAPTDLGAIAPLDHTGTRQYDLHSVVLHVVIRLKIRAHLDAPGAST
jgi:hypothetical protein